MRRRKLTRGQQATIAVAALVACGLTAGIFGGSFLRQRDLALGRAAEAAVQGPPCPVITRAAFEARRLKGFKLTQYEGVAFGRQFGHMECRALRYGGGWSSRSYPACQFTGPGLLHVTADGAEWFFAPGPGQPATVAVPHGRAQCVMASNFTIASLIGR